MCRLFEWWQAPSRETELREERRAALQRDKQSLDAVKKRLDDVLEDFDQTIKKMADDGDGQG